ncbi:phosphatase PAP2 family protein [Crenobacter sp. SG2305]|uniref:phosphatase PAP2 family protein n=1 Tax=Crenobacter oryzisoli TaxID=3056844 RepID=UPI0025AB5835|nr:phosphatase PAP2 family protein [Crenobacter sp. SG2305]MDN0082862.1 phosphatase PAP2 family protein [Crenobacter sp. SG2305]
MSRPSFHTALDMLFCLVLRHCRLGWPYLLLNAQIITSTPEMGGHYLIDPQTEAMLPMAPFFSRHQTAPSKQAEPAAGDVG